jgi:1-acyl-sn-glycerol-3-phosphate acyltransferase
MSWIDFPGAGQTTTDYEAFREIVAKTPRGGTREINDPERTRGRKYCRSYSNTFELPQFAA